MRRYRTVTTRFQEVTRSQPVEVKCSACGQRRTRIVKVTHTINPYNRNELGQPRSHDEVRACVLAELARQVASTADSTIICRPCQQSRVEVLRAATA